MKSLMPILHIAHALSWLAFSLLSGCQPVDAAPGVLAVSIAKPGLTEPTDPTPAAPQVSPDCTCSPKCTCNGCQCDAELGKRIAELPSPVVSQKPENGDTSRESVDGGDTKPPHLIATVADRGCPPCERWERETLPALKEAGWRVQVIRVPYGTQSTPAFRFGGKSLEGYGTRTQFMDWLRACMVKPAAAEQHPDLHAHRCGSCGTVWWHTGLQAARDQRSHNCPRCGRYQNVVYQFASPRR